jgi:exodeoxyribonuclease VII large subunit
MPELPANSVLTVSGITELIRETLEPAFAGVWVQGEISNLRRQESGHCYFSLKDEGAQLPAVLFRQNALRLASPLRDGMKVNAFGRISVYAPRGAYQLVCQIVLPAGQGSLAERFEALKRKLEAEGLFDSSRKKPLPLLPRTVGIITSPTGAVIRDVLSILSRRGWRGRIVVLPARVQGEGAAEEIAAMLKRAGDCGLFDAIILARGGGSLEDLWPFNEEMVARTVAACPVPTISGVGHETDFTLCDFAASVRAETPSAAAELISSLWLDAEERVQNAENDVDAAVDAAIKKAETLLKLTATRLAAASPERLVDHAELRLDDITGRLRSAASHLLRDKEDALVDFAHRVRASGPENVIRLSQQKLDQIALRLDSASPGSVVKRGYAIIKRGGSIVSDSAELRQGDGVRIVLRDGEEQAVIQKQTAM